MRSLISTYVIPYLERMVVKLASCKVPIMIQLVSVPEQAGLRLTWSQIPKAGLLASMTKMSPVVCRLLARLKPLCSKHCVPRSDCSSTTDCFSQMSLKNKPAKLNHIACV